MATKAKATAAQAAAAPPTDVTIPRSVLRQFIALVDGLEAADAAYKSCQATLFRNYAQSAYKAANVRTAVERAREALGE